MSAERLAAPSPIEFQILLALADEPRHGYGIMREIERSTAKAMRIGPGTLYGAIKRLLEAGWIEASDRRPSAGDDPRRRVYYRVTRTGRTAASTEACRLAELVREASAKGLIPSGSPRLAT